MTIDAQQIVGHTWTVRQVFTGRRYGVEAYQREYSWSTRNVEDLINDLTTRFRDQWRPEHDRRAIERYQPYFLGSVVTSRGDGAAAVVDGLHRLTTLTLLLIFLNRAQDGRTDVTSVLPLISSRRFDEESFNLQVTEGDQALWSLLHGAPAPRDLSPFDRTLLDRFADIENVFPDDLLDEPLPFFVDWLLHRVILIEIEADPHTAMEIFESTNDRGRRVTSLDLLEAVLVRGAGAEAAGEVAEVWRRRVAALDEREPNGASGFVKHWLRAKHAQDPSDDRAIGTAFHQWLGDQGRMLIGLHEPDDFRTLVRRDFDRFGARYGQLLAAAGTLTSGLEPVYYNAFNNVTLQYPLILAAVDVDADEAEFAARARMIAGAMDIFVARCMITGTDFRYPSIQARMFALARDIRGAELDKLAARLGEELVGPDDPFESFGSFGLHQRNRAQVRYLLARMAAWVDQRCGLPGMFLDYTAGRQPFEIEHILANRPELRPELSPRRFHELRDRFGALLLLPKEITDDHGDMSYLRKLDRYKSQNLLARSLHPACYEDNAAFLVMVAEYDLPFAPVRLEFDEAAIGRRQDLYRRLFELVWDPAEYGIGPVAPTARTRHQATFEVTPLALIEAGLLRPGPLVGEHLGRDYHAELTSRGRIRVESDNEFASVSRAATSVLRTRSWNGWTFWATVLGDGQRVTLNELRMTYLAGRAQAQVAQSLATRSPAPQSHAVEPR